MDTKTKMPLCTQIPAVTPWQTCCHPPSPWPGLDAPPSLRLNGSAPPASHRAAATGRSRRLSKVGTKREWRSASGEIEIRIHSFPHLRLMHPCEIQWRLGLLSTVLTPHWVFCQGLVLHNRLSWSVTKPLCCGNLTTVGRKLISVPLEEWLLSLSRGCRTPDCTSELLLRRYNGWVGHWWTVDSSLISSYQSQRARMK